MAIKKYNPTTPSRRFITHVDRSEVSSEKPPRSLVKKINYRAGRDNYGHISTRHKGGKNKQL